jgi:hypothetical protein
MTSTTATSGITTPETVTGSLALTGAVTES